MKSIRQIKTGRIMKVSDDTAERIKTGREFELVTEKEPEPPMEILDFIANKTQSFPDRVKVDEPIPPPATPMQQPEVKKIVKRTIKRNGNRSKKKQTKA